MNNLKARLGINDKLSKIRPVRKKFNKVKDNIPLHEDFNFSCDLMFMPTDKFGFKYILVCVDLASDEFDIEPLKYKTPEHVLRAFKKMFTRPYLNKPEYTLTSDAGSEFQGVFKKWLFDESIYHKITNVGRHQQLANIDSLIRQLSGLFIGVAMEKEKSTGKLSKGWLTHVDAIREELNKIRKKDLPEDYTTHEYESLTTHRRVVRGKDEKDELIKPKFNVGDMVHVLLDRPEDSRGNKLTGRARIGDNRYDRNARRVRQILLYSGTVLHRYLVDGISNVSYSDSEFFESLISFYLAFSWLPSSS